MTSRSDVDLALLGLMVGATVAVIGTAVFFADRSFDSTVHAQETARAQEQAEEFAADGVLFIPRVEILPALDPFAAEWEQAPALELVVTPQGVTMPVLEEPSIEQMRVQALTDGGVILWRLVWPDTTPDVNVDSGRFTDAVALQFPVTPDASYMMGEARKRVQILHWKGVWQRDVDEHFQDVQDLHPNYWTDLYWFADGEFPYPVPAAFQDRRSHEWFPAYRAGNPMADFHRESPVEELFAEGYGSLTHQAESVTQGGGAWQNGSWAVVFSRPLRTDDPLDYQFAPGGRGSMAVAVWEGSAGNVGGRKHWSLWYEFRIQAFGVTL
jgi:hypothetical protein